MPLIEKIIILIHKMTCNAFSNIIDDIRSRIHINLVSRDFIHYAVIFPSFKIKVNKSYEKQFE